MPDNKVPLVFPKKAKNVCEIKYKEEFKKVRAKLP
jgi:hypothetical protein